VITDITAYHADGKDNQLIVFIFQISSLSFSNSKSAFSRNELLD